MLRAALLVALLFAGFAPAAGSPAGRPADPYETFNYPIDLSAGLRSPQMPPPAEAPSLPAPRESESAASPEFSAHFPGPLRPGIANMINKRQRMPMFRLKGVTLFGGSISGSADSRSARVFLSWPTSP